MKTIGKLIIIAAPSGTGKTTIIKRLVTDHPEMEHSISCTTRPMRPGEVNGNDYHFMDEETFKQHIANDDFAEWAMVHGNYYGTLREPLDSSIDSGTDVLADLDVAGSKRLKGAYGARALSIFLMPPSIDELKRRLLARKSDPPEQQKIRLQNALEEMTHRDFFDHQVVNDVLDVAYAKVKELVFGSNS